MWLMSFLNNYLIWFVEYFIKLAARLKCTELIKKNNFYLKLIVIRVLIKPFFSLE